MVLLVHSVVYFVLIFLTRAFVVLANVASNWTKKLINDSQETCHLDMVNIWAMVESNCFWVEKCTAQSHALYAIP